MLRQITQRPEDEGQIIKVERMTLCEGGDYDVEGYRSLLSPKGREALESLFVSKSEDSRG